jgi:hypothetical protein
MKKRDSFITISEAIALCSKYKYYITKQGFIYIGLKHHLISVQQDHYVVNKNELIKYIKQITERIPHGWVKISTMYHLAKSPYHFYSKIKKSNIEIRYYSRERLRYAK